MHVDGLGRNACVVDKATVVNSSTRIKVEDDMLVTFDFVPLLFQYNFIGVFYQQNVPMYVLYTMNIVSPVVEIIL